MELKTKMAQYAALVESALDRAVPAGDNLPQAEVIKAMRYSLLHGGKRIRAMLALGFCEGLCGEISPALPAAVAAEMIHAYSLIHDDLPCMDDDAMRRGRPSCHIAFGEGMALLAGDALLTEAFSVLSGGENAASIGAERALRQMALLSSAAGVYGMVGGQVMDIADGSRTMEQLESTDRLKTGALIKAAARMGVVAAGATPEAEKLAEQYAGLLGLGFQVVDDILDVYGDTEKMGKHTGRDESLNKSTYLTVLGHDSARQTADRLHFEAAALLDMLPLKNTFLHGLTEMLRTRSH